MTGKIQIHNDHNHKTQWTNWQFMLYNIWCTHVPQIWISALSVTLKSIMINEWHLPNHLITIRGTWGKSPVWYLENSYLCKHLMNVICMSIFSKNVSYSCQKPGPVYFVPIGNHACSKFTCTIKWQNLMIMIMKMMMKIMTMISVQSVFIEYSSEAQLVFLRRYYNA